jgi:RimJ/RimL family protein N-acetyltransferase
VATATQRLVELVWLSPEAIDLILAGEYEEAQERLGVSFPADWPANGDLRFLRLKRTQMDGDPAAAEWLARLVVLPGERRIVGHAGFHGTPGTNCRSRKDAVEIGYTILEPYRRRGYATDAARQLVDWAAERGVPRVYASVSPLNSASLGVVRKLGFQRVGRHWNGEGAEELEFELELEVEDGPSRTRRRLPILGAWLKS